MATVTKSIGVSSRDYSTITAWEADLDNTGIYSAGDDAVGEAYNDSNFIYNHEGVNGGQLSINGGTFVGLNSVTLTVPSSDRHDGTLGTGTTILANGTTSKETVEALIDNCTIEWLSIEVDGYGSYSNGVGIYYHLNRIGGGYTSGGTIRNNIIRGENQPKVISGSGQLITAAAHEVRVTNNIVFDGYNSTDSSGVGINSIYGSTAQYIYNNTVYNCGTNILSGASNPIFKNNLAVGKQGTSDFSITSSSSHSNNLSSDGTADDYGGTDHVVDVVTANQFVSTVSGSEDLHILSTSDAFGAGADLGTTPDGVQYDIDGVDRDARGTAWDIGADQAAGVVVKTIGSAGRDYSTITAWEAALDNASIYQSSDDAVGECYNDSDFDESPTIDGGATVALNSRTIKVADGEKHDGTVGTGVRLLNSTSATKLFSTQAFANGFATRISGLEVDNNARFSTTYAAIASISPVRADVVIDNCITHNTTGNANVRGFEITNSWYNDVSINNCIAYNIGVTQGGNSVATGFWAKGSRMDVLNCVAYKITSTVNVFGRGYQAGPVNFSGGHELKNSISMGCEVDIIGFNANGHTNTNCLTSDATADGTGGIINKTASDQFVSTLAGSEDLHLLKTADAVGAGADLSSYTTTSDGNDTFSAIDVNGSNRAAFTGNSWDIGAHQYALTASIGTSSRDYSTIAAWEADLDNTAKYGNGSNAVGECYNDSVFTDNNVIINGGSTVGLNSVTLSVNSASRHDGTAGTGATIQCYTGPGLSISNTTVEYLTISSVGTGNYAHSTGLSHSHNISNTYIRNNIVYGDLAYRNSTGAAGPGISNQGPNSVTINNIIYNRENTNPSSVGGTGLYNHYNNNKEIYNNTIYRCGVGYTDTRRGTSTSKNNISTGSTRGLDFSLITSYNSTLTASNNLSSDDSADDAGGTGHIINVDPVKQFISTTLGSEDLHLVMGSDALNVGADLGNTPEGVQYDIDGYDRTASITWDIGADEAHEIDGEFGYKGFLSYINRTTLRAG